MSEKTKVNRQQLTCDFIEQQYLVYNRLRLDVVSQKVQIADLHPDDETTYWRDITNQDINDMVCRISIESGQGVTSREVLTVLQSRQLPQVHPLREYLNQLPPHPAESPIDWIDMLADQVHVLSSNDDHDDTQANRLWRICFKKWFVAMVAGWVYDGVVNQQVLVLIGRQGIFKTTWLERLIPPCLRQYSCKMASSRDLNKDDRLRIAEFGLISLDEIDAMTPRELNVLKSVITATDVNERAAYGYTKDRRLRLASFCASGNRREFLSDLTGNRRWLPFEVDKIQNPFHTIIPYENIYAQAVYLLQHDFNYWFDQDDIQSLEPHVDHFREQVNEEELLMVYFDIPAEGAKNAKFMTTAEISDKLINYGSIRRPMSIRNLAVVLQRTGFQKVRKTATRTRGWLVYERNADEINLGRTSVAQNTSMVQ